MKTQSLFPRILLIWLALSTLNFQPSTVLAQGTAFTYQGRLNDGANPANGNYDLRLTIYDSAGAGTLVAGPLTNSAAGVTNGLFTVTLDFGPAAFNGADRWLEIGVRTNGAGSFATLAPRQQIGPAPYAIFANTASNLSGVILNSSLPASPNFPGTVLATSFQSGGSGSFIAGAANTAGGQYVAIGGGEFNTNTAGYATIGGGYNNRSSAAQYITIGGGRFNVASANDATIGGGVGNSNSAAAATIGGGYNNIASQNNSTIGGGQFNNATGQNASVGGGQYNTAGGNSATVPGGSRNLASGDFSFAAGQQAQATNPGAFVWADSQNAPFASTATNQFNVRAGGGVRFVTGGKGMTMDGLSLLAGTIGASQIDDGGAAAYRAVQQAVESGGGDGSPAFSDLMPVTGISGGSPSLTLTINGAAFGAVAGFSGSEGISRPYAYVVEVNYTGAAVDPDSQIGLSGVLSFTRNSRTTTFAGIITACTLASSDGTNLLYTVRIESQLAYLALTTNYRVYQTLSVPDVAARVFSNDGLNAPTLSLGGSYTAHAMLVQYAETDLNFFSRQLENEGIFYFFNQGSTSPGLILGDGASAYLPAPNSPFAYYGNTATNVPAGAEYVRTFQKAVHQSTLKSTVDAHDFTVPTASLIASIVGTEGVGENYEFGNDIATFPYNQQLAQVRQGVQTGARAAITGSSVAPDLRAGYTFALNDQSSAGLAGTYVVTGVHHAGFIRVTNGVSTVFYGNTFEAVPASLDYRPPLATPRPQAQPCTAVVTVPSGQEIQTDRYGEVHVHFRWDRYGPTDDRSSAWVRVASPMAGSNGRGMLFLPRVGDEVLVSFLEGDPDRPVIVGSLYNGDNMPPYSLPVNKTVSTIRSTGSINQPAQINEIMFDDKAGSQVFNLQAAKDMNINANNNLTLQANNQITMNAPLTLNSALTVNGSQTVSGSLSVVGLSVSGTQSINGALSLTGPLGIDTGATVEGSLTVNTNIYLEDHPLYLRGRTGVDHNHGLAYNGSTVTNFGTGNLQVDGPVLWGFAGGILGTRNGGVDHAAVQWSPTSVTVNGTFNNNSDRNAKQDFSPVSPAQVLEKVAQLPVTEWSYKVDADTRHLGPMAQDFHSTFNLGTDDRHIAPIDEGGVALAAIQGLNEKVESGKRKTDGQLAGLEAQNAELKARLAALEKIILNQKPN